MNPNPQSTPFLFRNRADVTVSLAATCLLLLLGAAKGVAENPWTSIPLGWSSSSTGVASRGWSSWETTRGGTFGGSSNSVETPRHRRESFHSTTTEASFHSPTPAANDDAAIDPVMIKAAGIAEQRALSHSTLKCWRYVKEALVAAGGVSSYPQSSYARQAGSDLVRNYGFVQLPVSSAARAPVGSVLVYGGAGAGHVELRTARGFASDYRCNRPAALPFIGAFARIDKHHKEIQTAQIAGYVGAGS